MLVGTGETPFNIVILQKLRFKQSTGLKLFTDNYEHPMFEDGIQLIDMIYLIKHYKPIYHTNNNPTLPANLHKR